GMAPQLSVYPNPNTGSFTVALEGLNATEPVSITLLNAVGQEQYRYEGTHSAHHAVEGLQLKAGIYLLRVQQGETLQHVRVVIR
ncbi:MAG TPA: hypothetical protein DCP28_12550, partial [Cytophagales bacterium]|nr:hypothetical protein [Cytophagales bacterium]